jgi:hypothetical protein
MVASTLYTRLDGCIAGEVSRWKTSDSQWVGSRENERVVGASPKIYLQVHLKVALFLFDFLACTSLSFWR